MRMWWNGIHSRLKICRRKLAGSNPAIRTMQSVLMGSEYPVMDTLLFLNFSKVLSTKDMRLYVICDIIYDLKFCRA